MLLLDFTVGAFLLLGRVEISAMYTVLKIKTFLLTYFVNG